MHNMLSLSWLNVKNRLLSKVFFIGMSLAVVYTLVWAFVAKAKWPLSAYAYNMGIFLYPIILYITVSLIRDDIKENTTKSIFTGVFSRTEIMLSKGISLVMWGIIFAGLIEIDNIIISCIFQKSGGIKGFISFNHLQLFVNYIVIIFCVGSLMILIASASFKKSQQHFICYNDA